MLGWQFLLLMQFIWFVSSHCDPTCNGCFSFHNPNGCNNCYTSQNRNRKVSTCECMIGYTSQGLTTCTPIICHYSCSTCSDVYAYSCLTCSKDKFRSPDQTKCTCDASYFDAGRAICQACDKTCLTCASSSNQCKTCDPGKSRELVGESCPCMLHFTLNQTGTCEACHFSCDTCSEPLSIDSCLTCQPSYQRTFSQQSRRCECDTGYFEANVSMCPECHFSCASCVDGTTNCSSCNSSHSRNFVGTECQCEDRYYDGQTARCKSCHVSCLTCSSQLINACLTCSSQDFREKVDNTCCCFQRYFSIDQRICTECHYTCLTCSSSLDTGCLSCQKEDQRILTETGRCLCDLGYGDVKLSQCVKCHYTCSTCSHYDPNECLTCSEADFRIRQSNKCSCNPHSFDVGLPLCTQCNYRCDTCKPDKITCLTCTEVSKRKLIDKQCNCDQGFYDIEGLTVCGVCHQNCLECTSYQSNACLSCLEEHHRNLDEYNQECICDERYFDKGTSNCSECHYTCLTCSNETEQDCLTCDKENFRINIDGKCTCDEGFIENLEPLCLKCHYRCQSCEPQQREKCVLCENQILRSGPPTCACILNYYEEIEICLVCDLRCDGCVTKAINCIQCQQNRAEPPKCPCIQNFTEVGVEKNCTFILDEVPQNILSLKLSQIYDYMQESRIAVTLIVAQYGGLLPRLVNTNQFLALTSFCDFLQPEVVYQMHRLTMIPLFSSNPPNIQYSTEQTQIIIVETWDVTDKLYYFPMERRIQSNGVSPVSIYQVLVPIILLAALMILLFICLCLRKNDTPNHKLDMLQELIATLMYSIVESNCLLFNLTMLTTLKYANEVNNLDYPDIISLLIAPTYLTTYLGWNGYVTYRLKHYSNARIALVDKINLEPNPTQMEILKGELQSLDEQENKSLSFYLENVNPGKQYSVFFTLSNQFKKFFMAIIVVFVEESLTLITLLEGILLLFLLSALYNFPYKFRIVGILDLISYFAQLSYLVSQTIDLMQNNSDGITTFIIMIIVMVLDLLKLVASFILRCFERKTAKPKDQLLGQQQTRLSQQINHNNSQKQKELDQVQQVRQVQQAQQILQVSQVQQNTEQQIVGESMDFKYARFKRTHPWFFDQY